MNDPDKFCFICGQVILKSQRKGVTPLLQTAYRSYFSAELPNRNCSWVPQYSCCSCYRALLGWMKGTHKGVPFAEPMLWTEPSNHPNGCYFCTTEILGFSKALKRKIEYPSSPVPRTESMPVPIPPIVDGLDEEIDSVPAESFSEIDDPDFTPPSSEEPHLVSQEELNDLIRDLELPKTKAQLLASRLKQWNVLQDNVKVSCFWNHYFLFC